MRVGCLPKSLALRKYYKASKPNFNHYDSDTLSLSLGTRPGRWGERKHGVKERAKMSFEKPRAEKVL